MLTCGYPYNTNVGDAKTYGPELEMAAKVTDGLTVDFVRRLYPAYISEPKDPPGLPNHVRNTRHQHSEVHGQPGRELQIPISRGL